MRQFGQSPDSNTVPHTKHWARGRVAIGTGWSAVATRSGSGGGDAGGATNVGSLRAGVAGAGDSIGFGEASAAIGSGSTGVAGGEEGVAGSFFWSAGVAEPFPPLGASSGSFLRRRKNDIRSATGRDALDLSELARSPFSLSPATGACMPTPTERLRALGHELPPPPKPAGAYSPVVVQNGLAWVSGQIVVEAGKVVQPGLVDRDVPTDAARDLARRATLQALSALQATLGSLDRVERFLRVAVYVATSPGFDRPHEVANGATELLIELWGEEGRPARIAVGMASLPLNAPVEVEFLLAVR
jgi:enamine deaminase RidA (YjgF/YER057c/UK114 family)